jgi:hypothetical protein
VGPWGGAVLAAVQKRAACRRAAVRVGELCTLLPCDVVRGVLSSWKTPLIAAHLLPCVCSAWLNAVRGTHVRSCVLLVLRCIPAHDRVQWGVCRELHALVAVERRRIICAATRQHMHDLAALWVGVRVSVPWEADGPDVAYHGTVMDVRSRGQCVRVELDECAGRDRLRYHTIAIALLDRI